MRFRAGVLLAVCGLLLGIRPPASAQWVQTSGPAECCVTALAVDGPRVFALVKDHGLFVSRDAGANWTAVATPLPAQEVLSCIEAIDGRVFVGTESGLACFSDDGGASWRQIVIEKRKDRGEVTSFESLGATLFIGRDDGLFACRDLANEPTASIVTLPEPLSVQTLAVLGSDLYVGADKDMVLRAKKDSRGWTFTEIKFPNHNWPRCLTAVGSELFACGEDGIFRSPDQAASWTAVASPFPRKAETSSLSLAGPDLLALLTSPDEPADNAIARITKEGDQKWEMISLGSNRIGILCFADVGGEILAGASSGIYRSSDDGRTWARTGSGLPVASSVRYLAAIGRRLFASTTSHGGVYMSPDDGKTWMPIAAGLPNYGTAALLAVMGPNLFAGLNVGWPHNKVKGVYLSRDHGQTWVGAGLRTGQAIEDLVVIGQALYARMTDGIFVSKDLGASWVPCNEGLPWPYASCLVAGSEELFLGLYARRGPELSPSPLAFLLSFLAGGQELYAGGPPPPGLLYVLPKDGKRWKFTHIRFSTAILSMAKIGDTLFLGNEHGLYVSKNYGGSEKPLELTGEFGNWIGCLAAAGPNLVMTRRNAVEIVRSVGEEWRIIDTGLPAEHLAVWSLVVTEAGLFAGTAQNGVWRLPRAEIDRLLR